MIIIFYLWPNPTDQGQQVRARSVAALARVRLAGNPAVWQSCVGLWGVSSQVMGMPSELDEGIASCPGDGQAIRAGTRRVRLEPGDARHQSWNEEITSYCGGIV